MNKVFEFRSAVECQLTTVFRDMLLFFLVVVPHAISQELYFWRSQTTWSEYRELLTIYSSIPFISMFVFEYSLIWREVVTAPDDKATDTSLESRFFASVITFEACIKLY